MNKKVSIVLTAYNGEKFVSEQIESVMSQTYKNWELVICEDCSTDGTLKIVKKYLKKDKRIKLIVNKKNLGLAKNFERGLGYSSAEYIAICDVDDIWLPEKIEKQVTYLESNSNIGLVYHDNGICDENGKIVGHSFRTQMKGSLLSIRKVKVDSDDLLHLLRENHIPASTIMFRKYLIKKIVPIPANVYQDLWVSLIASAYSRIGYIDDVLMYYRKHSNNMVGPGKITNGYYIQNLFRKEFKNVFKGYSLNTVSFLNELSLRIYDNKKAKKLIDEKIICMNNVLAVLEANNPFKFFSVIMSSLYRIAKFNHKYHLIYVIYFVIYKINIFKR